MSVWTFIKFDNFLHVLWDIIHISDIYINLVLYLKDLPDPENTVG